MSYNARRCWCLLKMIINFKGRELSGKLKNTWLLTTLGKILTFNRYEDDIE